jgi:arylsulfate sulfotransferase
VTVVARETAVEEITTNFLEADSGELLVRRGDKRMLVGIIHRQPRLNWIRLLLAASAPCLASAMSVSLVPSAPSPVPVGTLVTWTAAVSDPSPGRLWYRFSAHESGQDSHVIKDYGPDTSLDWTASDHEGLYIVEVSVRNTDTGDAANDVVSFQMMSRVDGGQPVITPTAHPLVFLYSAPPCRASARMRVQFEGSDGVVGSTPFQDCQPGLSMNFYLAGLQPQMAYSVKHIVDTGSTRVGGPILAVTTPPAPLALATQTVLQPPPTGSPDGILLQATIMTNSLATDLNGNLVWYYPGNVTFITRPEAGGYFFAIVENQGGDQSQQIVREFDLTGMTVLETNAARVNEQLAAMGMRPISAFHHEARRLPDGRILVLGSVEQILTGVQGPGPVDVLGDMIIVMDSNLQVVWAWDAFDHLDVTRRATLNDQCAHGSCPSLFLDVTANDWLHGNSVQQTPDGNLLYSARSQDWVIKIDYQQGFGSGNVIWRLGKDGDFQINSTDPSPWFSHQHDPQFLADNTTLTLFDNGNVRNFLDPSANSRGQVLQLDEQNRVANLIVDVDMGQFSFALGAAQKLPNGDYHFDVGFLLDGTSIALEVDPFGNTVYSLHAGAPEYRSFRMCNLYTP